MWTSKLADSERGIVEYMMILKDRYRQALKSGNYIEAAEWQRGLREWERNILQKPRSEEE